VEDEAADVNADGVEIPDGGADVKEKADRRRNMADGLSLESLHRQVRSTIIALMMDIRTCQVLVNLFQANRSGQLRQIHQGMELERAD
jgi:hypothetical protein